MNNSDNSLTPLIEYAGFWRRVMATLIDTLWLVGLLMTLLSLLYWINPEYADECISTDLWRYDDWKLVVINDVIPFVIVIALWCYYAATPGKWLMDCKIVDATTGKPPSLTQAIVRYVAYIVSAIPLGLGFFWILWDKRKQGWHDKIARTVVVIHDEATIPLEQLMRAH